MEPKHRWQEWINIGLGLWLFVAPFFGFGHVAGAAAINGYVFGAIIIALAGAALFLHQVWEDWINMAIGVWLFVAPFALGFSNMHNVMLNYVNVGTALFGVAMWSMAMYPLYKHGEHISHVHKA